MKRFYEKVALREAHGGWQVTLDGRAIKTVKGAEQLVTSEALARALAAEWDAQEGRIDPMTMQLRDLTDYAIDVVGADPVAIVDKLIGYGDTDTLLYRAHPDEPMFPKQHEVWEPIVTAFEGRHRVEFVRVSGVVHRPQNAETLERLRRVLLARGPFSLAAIEMMTTLSASLITALSAAEPESDPRALWQAASLEEEWQAQLWGRDEEAEERRAKREADFLKARQFLDLAAA